MSRCKHPLGFVRVSVATTKFREIVERRAARRARRGLDRAGGALIIAAAFSRSVSRPIIELRDVAQAIAAGELERRPDAVRAG